MYSIHGFWIWIDLFFDHVLVQHLAPDPREDHHLVVVEVEEAVDVAVAVAVVASWRQSSNNVFHTLTVAAPVDTTCHKKVRNSK